MVSCAFWGTPCIFIAKHWTDREAKRKDTMAKLVLLVLMLYLSVPAASSYPWEQCDMIPVPSCTCWDPDRPVISCAHLNLTQVPLVFQMPHPEWPTIAVLDLSYNVFNQIPAFSSANSIEHLDISHTKASIFEHQVEGLRTIDLSYNQFFLIPRCSCQPHNFRGSRPNWKLSY